MTKAQLIERVAKDTAMTKKQAAQAVNALFDAMEETLISGEEIQISGLGSFAVKEVAAHTARNPRTNQTVELPATRRVTFSISKTLKDRINET